MEEKKNGAGNFFSSVYKKTREFIHRPWFYDKKFLVTLSVLCSVILWALLATNVSPVETKTISSVPITINTDTIKENFGLDFVEVISPESLKTLKMDITVSGRKYVLSQLTANDFSCVATANKSISKPGSYDLTVSITCNDPLLDVTVENSRQQIYVKFDRFVDKEFTVSNVIGVGATIPQDSDLIMGTPYSNVTKVTVSGPETEVTQIDSVIVCANVNKELSEGETFSGELLFFNSDGDSLKLSNVTVKTDATEPVSVTIPIKTTKQYKAGVTFKNAPKNFNSSKLPIKITPATITLIGSPDALENNDDTIYNVGEIDLSKLSNKVNKFTFDLSLSTGLEAEDNVSSVTVTIDLSDYDIKKLNVSSSEAEFNIVNYTGTRKVQFKTTTLKNIKIIGPSSVVGKLSADNIVVEADMTGKETVTGSCTVNATVYVKNRTDCWAIGTYEVEVKIG